MNAAHHDYFRVCFRSFPRQGERISRQVGNSMKDFGRLVVVRQDYGFSFQFEFPDGGYIGGVHRPFDLRNDVPHTLIYGRGFFQDFGRQFRSRMLRRCFQQINRHGLTSLMLIMSIYRL